MIPFAFHPGRPLAVALLLVLPLAATAQLRPVPAQETETGYTWALGAYVANGPSYPGSAERSTG
ncbi:MAG: hypothetical protein KAY02_06530, partial [Acidovorax sp.]|nr:hypothetical protein [Acidovorax sp.]